VRADDIEALAAGRSQLAREAVENMLRSRHVRHLSWYSDRGVGAFERT